MLSSSMMVWLRSFDAAARHSSFTRAAAELCISQGAVSQQVKSLETVLGRKLFLRDPRGLLLTSDGRRLYDVVRDAFRTLDAVLVQLQREEDRYEVTLSCSPSFAIGWLTPRLNSFFRENAAIHLKLRGEFQALTQVDLLRQGLDAAVRYDLGNYVDLEARPFLNEWLVPVASPDFLRGHARLRTPADLEPEWLLHDSSPWEGAAEFEEWASWFDEVGSTAPDFAAGRRFNLSQLAQAAAVVGQGVAMGRLALVFDDLVSGRLVPLFGKCIPSVASYYLVTTGMPKGRILVVEAWLRNEADAFRHACAKQLPQLWSTATG